MPPPERRAPYSDRACYRFVISPADARGLDLQAVTRAAVDSLARDLGPTARMPPWLAAEHRNTAHPHVHLVITARREVSPGRYRGVAITKTRLAHIKEAVAQEIVRQRGDRLILEDSRDHRLGRACSAQRVSRLTRTLNGLARSQIAELREYERDSERELERGLDADRNAQRRPQL